MRRITLSPRPTAGEIGQMLVGAGGVGRVLVGLCAVGAVLLLTSCSKSDHHRASHPALVTVRLQNIAFHPAQVTIDSGSSVRWVWLDKRLDTSHNVTPRAGGAGGLRFKASSTRLSGSYTVRFEKTGRYLYECTIHPASMQGSVTVH
jgi:plastocyanin